VRRKKPSADREITVGQIYEVLAGSLNFREKPGGRVMATLPRATRLEEVAPPHTDDANTTWLTVKLLPQGTPSGVVSAQFVARLDAVGQDQPQATASGEVTEERLRLLAPTAKPWIITALATNFQKVAAPYGILDNPRRLCHFLAQAAHESAGFRTLEEFGGAPYWSRYEGRADLGNSQPGDGVLFHGRGIFQLTGRANYRAMGGRISVELEADPHLASEGDVSLHTACEYWKKRRLQALADSNDITELTRRINGGFNGLAERQAYFRRAWSIWGDKGQPSGV
jgi:putative chitinase